MRVQRRVFDEEFKRAAAASNHTAGSRRMVHELALKHVRAGRHNHLHQDSSRVRLSGRRDGSVLTPGHRLARRVVSWHVSESIEDFASIDFRDVDHVRYQAKRFIDHVYNQRRLHSTLGYQSPIQFERAYIRRQQLTNSVV